jgi:hypothetical protein
LPVATGISGLGTGVATALAVNIGSAGAPVLFNGALGTPSSGTVTNLTGTASININGTVGATTATTGAFTTLTTSSTVTLNGGTTNGVAYLNGSKVLTTGSGLTFDGTNFGIGIASPGTVLNVVGATGIRVRGANSASDGALDLRADNTSCTINANTFGTAVPLAFQISGSEQMRLTSTGLGIGTSSPTEKLQITSFGPAGIRLLSTAGSGADLRLYGSDGSQGLVGTYSNHPLTFYTNSAERMRLDSVGNLGLWVTPSAWVNSWRAIDVTSGGSSLYGSLAIGGIAVNAFLDSGVVWRYKTSYAAGRYEIGSTGIHGWHTATSGAAGNAIGFTQAMTLDASGKLSIGTTTTIAGVTLNVAGGINSTNGALNVSGNGGFYNAANKFGVDNNNGVTRFYSSGPNSSTRGSYDFRLTDSVGSLDISGMTLDASGRLGLGAAPAYTIDVRREAAGNSIRLGAPNNALGTVVEWNNNSGFGRISVIDGYPLLFSTNNAERARIDSSGNFFIGRTSIQAGLGGSLFVGDDRQIGFDGGSGSVYIRGNVGGWATGMYAVGSSGTFLGGFGFLGGGNSATYYWVGTAYNGTGVLLNYGSTSWSTLSDEREKNIHGVIENALDKIVQFDGIYYNYKSDAEGTRHRVGFSAQKVQAAFPEAVEEVQREADNPSEETKRLTLSATDIVPLLVQAIKELKAEFDAYKATHP